MDGEGTGLRPHGLGETPSGDATTVRGTENSPHRGRLARLTRRRGAVGTADQPGTGTAKDGRPQAGSGPEGGATARKSMAKPTNSINHHGSWWNRVRRRADRTTGTIALLVVGGLIAGSVAVGIGAADALPKLGDLGAWLPNSGNGSASHVNGPAGRTDGRVALPGSAGNPMQVVEDGGTVLVVDEQTGVVSRIDPAHLTVPYRYDYGAPGLRLVAAGGASWLVDEGQGTVRPINPVDLTPLAPAVDLGDRPLGRAQADSRGTLWVPLPGKGQVVPVRGAIPGAPVRVAEPGSPLRLTMAGDRPVVTDGKAGTVTVVAAGGPTLTVRLPGDLGRADPGRMLAPETTPGSLVPVLAGDTGVLVLVDLDKGAVTAVPLGIGAAAGSYAPPQVLGTRVYTPDRAHGNLLVYDTAKAQFDPQIKVTGQAAPLESFVRDGMLWVNDRDSSAAAVVDASGKAHPVGKYAQDAPQGDGSEPPPQVPGDPPPAGGGGKGGDDDKGNSGAGAGPRGDPEPDRGRTESPNKPLRPEPPVTVGPPASGPEEKPPVTPGPGLPTAPTGPAVPTVVPTSAVPTEAPSSSRPATSAPATSAVPSSAAPTSAAPSSAPPTTSAPPTSSRPPSTPPSSPPPTPPAPVTPPGQPEATSGPGRIVVTFAPSAGAKPSNYTISGLASGQTATPAGVDADGPFQFTVNGGSCDKEYGFKVVAHYADGRTATSPASTPVRPCVVPGSVGKPKATPATGGHGGTVGWTAAPANGGGEVTYTVEVDGKTQQTKELSAKVSGLENSKSYQVTVTAQTSAGKGTPGTVKLDLTPPAKTLNVGPNRDNGVDVGVRNLPAASHGGRAGAIPSGYNGPITVHCQVTGERATRDGTSIDSAIWDRVTWEGKQGWVSDLYIRTTNSDKGTYSSNQLWQCT